MRRMLLIPAVLMLAIFFTSLYHLLPDNTRAIQSARHFKSKESLLTTTDATASRDFELNKNDLLSAVNDIDVVTEPPKIDLLFKKRPFQVEVFGRVTDSNLQPLEGVYISEELNQRSTRTDEQGRYRMPVTIPKNKYPFLIFLRNGYREERKGVVLGPDNRHAPFEINVALSDNPGTTSFNGWIGNNFGQSVAGLTVKIKSRGTMSMDNLYYAVSTDEYGEFHFEGIRSGISYRFEVLASADYPSHVIDELEVTMQTPRLSLTINKLNLVNITGMVVNQNSIPIPELSMTVQNLNAGSPPQRITTDSSGFFELNAFPAGEVRFSGKVPDYFKISGIKLSDAEYQDLTLVVDRGGRYLSGWVSDSSGLPVAQARVTLDAELESDNYQSYSFRSRKTDNAGRFEFDNLSDIDHVVTVYAKGYKKQEVFHQFDAGNDYLSIRLNANLPSS